MVSYQNIENDQNSSFIVKMKEDHPEGTTVVLIHINNLFFPVNNRRGTVNFVDEAACVHVDFEENNVIPLNYRFGDRWRIRYFPFLPPFQTHIFA